MQALFKSVDLIYLLRMIFKNTLDLISELVPTLAPSTDFSVRCFQGLNELELEHGLRKPVHESALVQICVHDGAGEVLAVETLIRSHQTVASSDIPKILGVELVYTFTIHDKRSGRRRLRT